MPSTAPPIWLPTGPARWSGLEVSRPRLILFYHVEKTGGTAVMKWLHKMASYQLTNPNYSRLTSLMDFTHTSCFFSLHEELFPGYSKAWDPRRCKAPKKPDWKRSAVAVEFHSYTRRRYWLELVPYLPALRARYAAVNGTLLTVATFREPRSHIMSSYHMWPPSHRCKCGGSTVVKHALPLPSWLPNAVGLQAGSLSLDSWVSKNKGFHNLHGCDALPLARVRLQTFDLVGVMDCIASLLTAMCTRLDWPCEEDAPRMELALKQSLRFKPHGVSPRGLLMREAIASGRLAALNATIATRVMTAAACDRAIYDDALRRIRLPPPARAGEALNRSMCAGASYV